MRRPPRLGLFFLVLGAVAYGEDAPKRARAISPHMAEVLAAKMPAYQPPGGVAAKSAPAPLPDPVRVDAPAGESDVVTLPRVVINEGRLPTPEQMLSDQARAELAMNRYLGSSDDLDRGILNRFTLATVWRKIPILGKLMPSPFGIQTNEERAMVRYREDKHYEETKSLLDLGNITTKTGDRAMGERIRRETQRIIADEPGRLH